MTDIKNATRLGSRSCSAEKTQKLKKKKKKSQKFWILGALFLRLAGQI